MHNLNVLQQQAAEAGDGPLVIIAGPGTGKTKTLTARVAYLLQQKQVPAEHILALTFTNKAAAEMRSRVQSLLGTKKLPRIATFHAFCQDVLQAEQEIVSEPERQVLIGELPRPAEAKQLSNRELGLFISRAKNQAAVEPWIAAVVELYNQQLRANNLMDFDDILLEVRDRLAANPNEALQHDYVLVDEFQDTNALQYDILRQVLHGDNLFAIGDPRQSIYGFRGADSSVLQRLSTDYPQLQTLTLSTNYRSTKTIVDAANNVFPQWPLVAYSPEVGQVQIMQTLNEYSEARFVADTVQAAVGGTDFLHATHTDSQAQFCDFAVLYRTHQVGLQVQRQLAESGIPYQVVGQESSYAHPVVQKVLALMQSLQTGERPPDRTTRLLGIASQTIDLLTKQRTELLACRPSELVAKLAQLAKVDTAKHTQRLRQLTNTLLRFATIAESSAYFEQLNASDFYDQSVNAVGLMTIHAAKGLEFNHVFLCGAEEGILPHGRKGTDVDEEKRLFFVAITRAKRQLDILHAKSRRRQLAKPSRFIASFTQQSDPAMASDQKRWQKRHIKQRQKTLFDL